MFGLITHLILAHVSFGGPSTLGPFMFFGTVHEYTHVERQYWCVYELDPSEKSLCCSCSLGWSVKIKNIRRKTVYGWKMFLTQNPVPLFKENHKIMKICFLIKEFVSFIKMG